MTTEALCVVKYGGAALGSEESLRDVIRELRARKGPIVTVVSAREGVTDLLKAATADPASRARHEEVLRKLTALHAGGPREVTLALRALERQLTRLRSAMRQLPPRARRYPSTRAPVVLSDAILAQGERLAAHWFADRLRHGRVAARALEADLIGLSTDDHHGEAIVLLDRSELPVRRAVTPLLRRGQVPVVTGFLGRSPSGKVATLGRGGSDYSATCLGYLLGASRVELVKKDVSILTADPRIVPAARPLSRLSYEEAEELAQFGAKVLHPLTVEPARARGVEVVIRSLEDPTRTTTIGPALPGEGIRALTLLSPTAMLLLRVPGGRQRRGVIAEVSRTLAAAEVNVITMFTSSALLIVLVEMASGRKARRALDPFARGDGASLEGPLEAALVTAIGEGVLADLGGLPGDVASRALGVSATSRTLSFAVPMASGRESLVSLHRALVELPRAVTLEGTVRGT
ncbi:MAG: aspartate kinase [Euryarchaeota archaeon]|nr:aspartate kinase [Euryarchaeota archaeon]MDE1837107.1 aspartate kinase [Euryarchaeota archaeon]MDE1879681.1 aspartate kinase [Euryarchaeota archaeon]MDE2045207.1 aspartate kinase [Thermoplasmata archaeon]